MSETPQLSSNGRVVVFTSDAGSLSAADTNVAPDVFALAFSNAPPAAEANGPYEARWQRLSAAGSVDPEGGDLTGGISTATASSSEIGVDALHGDETGESPTFWPSV
ncbi:MAG: hypothetical protein U0736_11755 [Gemmataceae bacterium]